MYDKHLKIVIKEIFILFIDRYKYLFGYLIDISEKTIIEKSRLNKCIKNINKNNYAYTDDYIEYFFRITIKEIIVKESRDLVFYFIDGFIYTYKLPLWSFIKNCVISKDE